MQDTMKSKRGRPKKLNNTPRPIVQIRFIPTELERLDATKDKAGYATRSEFARALITEALNVRDKKVQ